MKLELSRSAGAVQDSVVLNRKASPLMRHRILLLAFAIPGVCLGLGGLFLGINSGLSGDDGMMAAFFVLFGVTFAIGGFLAQDYMKRDHAATPSRMVFNNRRAALELYFDASTDAPPRIDIPYSALDGFRVKPVKQSSDNRTWYVYHVMLVRQDGSQWHLWTEPREDAAEDAIEYLQKNIQWKKPFVARSVETPPKSVFKVQQLSGTTSIEWNGQRSLQQTFLLCLMITNFDLLFLVFYKSMPFFLVLLFLAGSVFPLLYFVYRLTPRGRMYHIEVTDQVVRSDVPGVFGIKRQESPVRELSAVSFDLEDGQLNPSLSLLTETQRKQVRQAQQNPMSMLDMELLKSLRAIHRVQVGDLTLAELLELERLLEKEVQDRTGRQPT